MVNTIFIILAYFIGSISFGILLSKIFKIQDPRSFGSKNPGATNVMRSGKKFVALLTLLGDMLKGTLVVLIAKYYLNFNDDQVLLIAAVVFIGHLFPVYYQFKGGKGVATALGVLIAIDSNIAILVLLIWLIVFLVSRISSLSAITAALCLPIIAFFMHIDQNFLWLSLFLSMFLIYRHKENIKNLLEKKESNFK
ncbi:MAG: glycerol-3-phosphate 1-O-acyltransferase PlsY [Methylophilaceae bacterium]|jgi:glycerol-3-phosphate acyltransferase PlsY|nr:glycerol-3-phosphate 1-O-acyltransferase PlsY [Methylophilaceae bacterium]NCV27976.1 glycerol-3-phosphate 1-O-acyltransferase [Nitrosomonadales bacterium]NCV38612.1 glycerol-3-phosphate 1-O-acyltransferase [Betaproteobacteria bacterium]NCW63727.1 glycerol-3-phosphate 1-O-acyltransferase [Betaproteobacteria bacterium]